MAYSQHPRGGRRRGAAAAAWLPAPSCSPAAAHAGSSESLPLTPRGCVRSEIPAGTLSEPARGQTETREGRKHKDGLDSALSSPCSIPATTETHNPLDMHKGVDPPCLCVRTHITWFVQWGGPSLLLPLFSHPNTTPLNFPLCVCHLWGTTL